MDGFAGLAAALQAPPRRTLPHELSPEIVQMMRERLQRLAGAGGIRRGVQLAEGPVGGNAALGFQTPVPPGAHPFPPYGQADLPFGTGYPARRGYQPMQPGVGADQLAALLASLVR